jgi:hypothetical protein
VRGPIRYDDVSFFLFYFIFVKERKERADKNSTKINIQIVICTFFFLGVLYVLPQAKNTLWACSVCLSYLSAEEMMLPTIDLTKYTFCCIMTQE